MRQFYIRYWPYLFIAISSLLFIFSLTSPGWYSSHDGIFHIYRTEEALSMLKLGQFPLRWAGNFDQGFGIPLFSFIYPLPYYLSAVLSYFIGSMWSLKILTILCYAAGGLGMYKLLNRHGRGVAIFASVIYLLTPYQFLNIFVRGALGEILALALIPWVLASFISLFDSNVFQLKWYHPIPLALLLIAHNFLGILFAVFLFGYILTHKSKIKHGLASLLISLSLSVFFIIPMIFERNLLYSYDHPDLNFRYDQHFATIRQLIYSKWDYWYSMPGIEDGMSFQLGLAQLTLAALSTLVIVFKRPTSANLYLLLAYWFSLFLMTARSTIVWENISILRSIQFPWRFLFMPAVLTPLLAIEALKIIKLPKLRYILMSLLLVLALFNVRNYRNPMKFFDNTEYTDLYRLYFNKTSTTFRTEILPKWGTPAERYKSDEVLINSGNMTLDALTFTPLSLDLTINNKPDASVAKVTVLRNYFPSWHIVMDGKQKITLSPTAEGMMSFEPELGVHNYQIKVGSTTLETYANLISFIGLIILGILWFKPTKKSIHTK